MNKLSVFLLVLINFGIFNYIEAQTNTDISKQIWIDVNPSYFGYSGLELFGDAGVRWEVENDGWMRLVMRPSIRIPIGKRFFFAAGLGNFFILNKVISNRWKSVHSKEYPLLGRKDIFLYDIMFA